MKEWMNNKLLKQALLGLAAVFFTTALFANPVLDHIAGGQVSLQQTQNNLTVNQTSQKAIINWQSFNIGQQEATHFQQPAGGIALNRINGAQGASQIYGTLTATGEIILMNPAGIFFGPSAYVNVGGLIATTANISDQQFLQGQYQFTQVPNYSGAVINEGQIIAAQNGLVALIAPGVINHGLIQANLGHVVLASGEAFTMSFAGNDLINFTIDQKTTAPGHDPNGQALTDGVLNTGSLIANGGTINVTAQAAAGVLNNVINMQGIAQAQSVGVQNGEIILSGDPNGGVVNVAGRLDASGKGAGQTGGNVKVTGYDILVDSPSVMDVSGDAGGGSILIGGNAHGVGTLSNANATVLMPGTQLIANALTNGDGGQIVLWSDQVTKAYGSLSARGGASSGNGGWIETSGHYLDVNGIQIDTRAPSGQMGTWLLDPTNIYIANNQANATTAGMSGVDNSASTGVGVSPETFAATGAVQDSLLTTSDLVAALASTDVVVTTTNGAGTGAGNIIVVDPISWSANTNLSLQAANDMTISSAITGSGLGSSLTLQAGGTIAANAVLSMGSNITLTSGILQLGVASNGLGSGPLIFNGGALISSVATASLGNDFTVNGTVGFSGGNNLTLSGNGTLNGTLNTNSSVFVTLTGILSGLGGITNSGTNVLQLTNANTYSGGTIVTSGTINGTNNASLGTGTVTMNGGTLQGTGNIVFTNNFVINGATSFASNAPWGISGTITLNALLNADNTSTTTLSGVVSGAGAIDVIFGGLSLLNANTYSGGTTVSGGGLFVGNNSALGTGSVTVSGGTMQLSGVSISNPLILNGAGAGSGALVGTGSSSESGSVTLGSSTTIGTLSGGDSLALNGAIDDSVIGADTLQLSGPGTISLGNNVGSVKPLSILTSNAGNTVLNASVINTVNQQNYNGPVSLSANPVLTISGNNSSMTFNAGISGAGQSLSLQGTAGNNNTFSLTGPFNLANLSVSGGSGGVSSLSVGNASKTWSITGSDSGHLSGISGSNITGAFTFNNIANLTGGSGADQFVFANNASISGLVNGGSLASQNTLNYLAYTTNINAFLSSSPTPTLFNGTIANNGTTITTYQNINNLIANGNNTNILNLPNKMNTITITGPKQGYVNDPLNFKGFGVISAPPGTGSVVNFTIPIIFNSANQTASFDGVVMSFVNIGLGSSPFSQSTTAQILTTQLELQNTSNTSADWIVYGNLADIESYLSALFDVNNYPYHINLNCGG